MHYSTLLSMGVAAFHFSTTAMTLSIPTARSLETRADESVVPFPFDVQETFDIIDQIPDEVVEDGQEEAFKAYIDSIPAVIDTRDVTALERRAVSWPKCALAVGSVIVDTVLPLGKVIRLVKLVKRFGGARKVARALWNAKSKNDIKKAGATLWEIFGILSGVKDVVDNCFHFKK